MDAFIEFVKILVPASVVLYAAYLLVRTYVQKEVDMKRLDVKGRSIELVLPIRLQAYERMALFLERMAPQNLLVRVSDSGMPSREFHQLLLGEIRNEFNHNAAQQVYISDAVWTLIKNAKEDLIVVINDAASEMTLESTSLDLSKKIFEKSVNKEVDPLGHALLELKKEIQQVF
jgi:hypothetical protein